MNESAPKRKVSQVGKCSCLLFVALLMACATAASAQMPTKNSSANALPPQTEKGSTSSWAVDELELRHELTLHPDSAETLYKLGAVLRLENKPMDSLAIYTKAAALAKPTAEQLRSVAMDYVLLNDFADAIRWLQTAARLDPKDAEVFYSLGRCFYTQSSYRDAELAFQRALDLKPDHLKAEENLGLVYDFENQPEKAEAALRKAVEWAGENSRDEWPFLDLGSFLLDHDHHAEAAKYLQKAASINPNCAACHEKLGRALVAGTDKTEGIKELEVAAQLDPRNPKVHFELGRAYRESGQTEKARAEFNLSQSLYGQHSNE